MSSSPLCSVLAGARLHHSPTAIKEEVLPRKDQPEFQYLALLASRCLLAPDTWKCKRAQVSLKATIDVPMPPNKMVMGFWKSEMATTHRWCRSAMLYSSMCNSPGTRRHVKRIRHEKRLSGNKSQRTKWSHNCSVEPEIHGTEARMPTAVPFLPPYWLRPAHHTINCWRWKGCPRSTKH